MFNIGLNLLLLSDRTPQVFPKNNPTIAKGNGNMEEGGGCEKLKSSFLVGFFYSSCCREVAMHNNNQQFAQLFVFCIQGLVWVAG